MRCFFLIYNCKLGDNSVFYHMSFYICIEIVEIVLKIEFVKYKWSSYIVILIISCHNNSVKFVIIIVISCHNNNKLSVIK